MNVVSKDAVGATRREVADDIGPDPCWTLSKYHRESEGLLHAGHFSAKVVNEDNCVIYNSNKFQRNTAFSAWKRRWAALHK